jgi:hypothetical protein
MQLMSNGRVRRTEIEWREILTRWKQSGLGPAEFCKKEDLRPTSFQRWQERLGVEPAQAQFVPVTSEGPSMIATPSWALEITLPNGVQLRFQG